MHFSLDVKGHGDLSTQVFGHKAQISNKVFKVKGQLHWDIIMKKEWILQWHVVILNDFQAEGENEVNNELANRISLFYADATPMLKTLSDGTTKFVSEVRLTGEGSEHFETDVWKHPHHSFFFIRLFTEQEPAHREHDGLLKHNGDCV